MKSQRGYVPRCGAAKRAHSGRRCHRSPDRGIGVHAGGGCRSPSRSRGRPCAAALSVMVTAASAAVAGGNAAGPVTRPWFARIDMSAHEADAGARVSNIAATPGARCIRLWRGLPCLGIVKACESIALFFLSVRLRTVTFVEVAAPRAVDNIVAAGSKRPGWRNHTPTRRPHRRMPEPERSRNHVTDFQDPRRRRVARRHGLDSHTQAISLHARPAVPGRQQPFSCAIVNVSTSPTRGHRRRRVVPGGQRHHHPVDLSGSCPRDRFWPGPGPLRERQPGRIQTRVSWPHFTASSSRVRANPILFGSNFQATSLPRCRATR